MRGFPSRPNLESARASGELGEPLPLWVYIPLKVITGLAGLYLVIEAIRGLRSGTHEFLGWQTPGDTRLVAILSMVAGLMMIAYGVVAIKKGPQEPREIL